MANFLSNLFSGIGNVLSMPGELLYNAGIPDPLATAYAEKVNNQSKQKYYALSQQKLMYELAKEARDNELWNTIYGPQFEGWKKDAQGRTITNTTKVIDDFGGARNPDGTWNIGGYTPQKEPVNPNEFKVSNLFTNPYANKNPIDKLQFTKNITTTETIPGMSFQDLAAKYPALLMQKDGVLNKDAVLMSTLGKTGVQQQGRIAAGLEMDANQKAKFTLDVIDKGTRLYTHVREQALENGATEAVAKGLADQVTQMYALAGKVPPQIEIPVGEGTKVIKLKWDILDKQNAMENRDANTALRGQEVAIHAAVANSTIAKNYAQYKEVEQRMREGKNPTPQDIAFATKSISNTNEDGLIDLLRKEPNIEKRKMLYASVATTLHTMTLANGTTDLWQKELERLGVVEKSYITNYPKANNRGGI